MSLRKVTDEIRVEAIRLRRSGMKIKAIGELFGISRSAIGHAICPRPSRSYHYTRKNLTKEIINRPPQSVLDEREYRLSRNPETLSAALCGDPLPGYSALDARRRAQAT